MSGSGAACDADRGAADRLHSGAGCHGTACITTPNLPTNIMDFKGFDSSIILILRGGIPRLIENFRESLNQAILVGIMLVGRLCVPVSVK